MPRYKFKLDGTLLFFLLDAKFALFSEKIHKIISKIVEKMMQTASIRF